jgi:hypothetical protein
MFTLFSLFFRKDRLSVSHKYFSPRVWVYVTCKQDDICILLSERQPYAAPI